MIKLLEKLGLEIGDRVKVTMPKVVFEEVVLIGVVVETITPNVYDKELKTWVESTKELFGLLRDGMSETYFSITDDVKIERV